MKQQTSRFECGSDAIQAHNLLKVLMLLLLNQTLCALSM